MNKIKMLLIKLILKVILYGIFLIYILKNKMIRLNRIKCIKDKKKLIYYKIYLKATKQ